jgi:hypothetical protein
MQVAMRLESYFEDYFLRGEKMSRTFAYLAGLSIGAFCATSITLGLTIGNEFYSMLAIALGIKFFVIIGGLVLYMVRVTDKDEKPKFTALTTFPRGRIDII